MKRQKAEVLGMILEEFDEESFVRNTREEGYEEGFENGLSDGKTQKAV